MDDGAKSQADAFIGAQTDGLEEVSETVADSIMVEVMVNEDGHHSMPSAEPKKPYRDRIGLSKEWKSYAMIWGVALILILGVVGAFVGGYLQGEMKEAETIASDINDSINAPTSLRYRDRNMRKGRHHRGRIVGNGHQQKDLSLAEVLTP